MMKNILLLFCLSFFVCLQANFTLARVISNYSLLSGLLLISALFFLSGVFYQRYFLFLQKMKHVYYTQGKNSVFKKDIDLLHYFGRRLGIYQLPQLAISTEERFDSFILLDWQIKKHIYVISQEYLKKLDEYELKKEFAKASALIKYSERDRFFILNSTLVLLDLFPRFVRHIFKFENKTLGALFYWAFVTIEIVFFAFLPILFITGYILYLTPGLIEQIKENTDSCSMKNFKKLISEKLNLELTLLDFSSNKMNSFLD